MQSRILEIYARYTEYIAHLTPLRVEDEYFKVILHFVGGSNLRVTEEWEADALVSYSYYWLTEDNRLKVGWDNAPHHTEMTGFPNHKHVGVQADRQPSDETTCLEEVMQVILPQLSPAVDR